MRRSVKKLQGHIVCARDGDIGKVSNLYFDDRAWTIRYLVVDTGGWLSGRRVLISPVAVREADWAAEKLPVALTKGQVEHSPSIYADMPVSRQREIELARYYQWPYYWAGANLWAGGMYPGATAVPVVPPKDPAASDDEQGDPHLRSAKEVMGYRIVAQDGEVGHVDDFLFDDQTWTIQDLVVSIGGWLSSRRVVVPCRAIERVSWDERAVQVSLSQDAVQRSPDYDPSLQDHT
jgi:sporulation protein YlmC with PRC-barrel domain